MTFASRPWYPSYATTTEAWGLDQLADQQLAGTLMWFPTGLLNAAVALWLLLRWLNRIDGGRTRQPAPTEPGERPGGARPVGALRSLPRSADG